MPEISPVFVWSDSWILLAIRWAGREKPASLSDILYGADAINRSIPTAEELDGALNRLLAAGLVSHREGGFLLTESAHEAIANVSKESQGIIDLSEDMNRLLVSPCDGPNLHSVVRQVTITDQDVSEAFKVYAKFAEEELTRILKSYGQ